MVLTASDELNGRNLVQLIILHNSVGLSLCARSDLSTRRLLEILVSAHLTHNALVQLHSRCFSLMSAMMLGPLF